ncbi:MAG: heavy metal-associated domain-containing protein [Candidatus Poseidoniales archaeon]|jgi:copper chaperone CopZ|nr:heavy metal-associated domain-containing protein [archaeon]
MDTTHHVSITGMTCGGCSGRVTNVLMNTPGVKSADISHAENKGTIVTDDSISTAQLLEIIEGTGFSATV